MKKTVFIVCLMTCVLLLTSCVNSKYSRVVGDYDTSKLKGSFVSSENEAYQIGKNSVDRPVFKSTQEAWDAFIVDYAVGIATIQRPLTLIRSHKMTISFIQRTALICRKAIPQRLRNSAKMFRTSSRFMQIVFVSL